ncbi:MAG: VOC family protein [Woeseia sp.]
MHHSRVSTLMIDCLEENFDDSLAFWSEALGFPAARKPSVNQRYLTLGTIGGRIHIRLQKVKSDPGYHLDIETDDVSGEVQRLENHGAKRKYRIKRWWVMEDPGGNAFCVIRPETEKFPRGAKSWNDRTPSQRIRKA